MKNAMTGTDGSRNTPAGWGRLPSVCLFSPRRSKSGVKRRSQNADSFSLKALLKSLIQKYEDPRVVFEHLSLGQLMKYELDEKTGCIYERGKLIFDGEKLVKDDG